MAVANSASVSEDNILNGSSVLTNDTDVDGGPKSVIAVNGGAVNTPILLASGATVTMQANGTYVYNQNGAFNSLGAGQTASDSFSYTLNGGSQATVSITINGVVDVNDAVDDFFFDVESNVPDPELDPFIEDNLLTPTSTVLANDLGGGSGVVTAVNGSAANVGQTVLLSTGATIIMQSDGTFTFDRNGSEIAPTFTYTLNGVSVGTVTVGLITIIDNEAPIFPVLIDLDGDGLELTHASSGVAMDVDNDDINENMAWVEADDGLLAVDLNSNGHIDSMDEFVFTNHDDSAQTDMEALRNVFDTNQDGLLSNEDDNWSDFGIWQDSNQDGINQEGEFFSLNTLGFVVLDLNTDNQAETINGNYIFGKSLLTHEDGHTLDAYDVGLDVNEVQALTEPLSLDDVLASDPLFIEESMGQNDNAVSEGSASSEPVIMEVSNVLSALELDNSQADGSIM